MLGDAPETMLSADVYDLILRQSFLIKVEVLGLGILIAGIMFYMALHVRRSNAVLRETRLVLREVSLVLRAVGEDSGVASRNKHRSEIALAKVERVAEKIAEDNASATAVVKELVPLVPLVAGLGSGPVVEPHWNRQPPYSVADDSKRM